MLTRSFVLSALLAAAVPSVGAAPPARPGGLPPDVDIAYMNPTGGSLAVRGLQVAADGAVGADTTLWGKLSGVYGGSMSWDPDGAWLAWAQVIDRKNTRAIVAGKPGSAPTTVLKFPNGDITRRHGLDTIAWGRGCNGRSVIVFSGDQLWNYLDALYVFDPFESAPQAHRLHVKMSGPEGSPDGGHGIAFSPQGQFLAFVERDDVGRNHVVALPLTCLPGDALPTAAGPVQRLFPVESDAGVDGRRAWSLGLDWSADGNRLAAGVAPLLVWEPGYRSWGYARVQVGELAYSFVDGVEQVSAAGPAMQEATFGPAPGQDEHSDELPSWGPAAVTAACDRVAFSRSGTLMLLDVPRAGFTPADCVVPAPVAVSSKLAVGLDWK